MTLLHQRNPLKQNHIIQKILVLLPPHGAFSLSSVCKAWRETAYNLPKETFNYQLIYDVLETFLDHEDYSIPISTLTASSRRILGKFVTCFIWKQDYARCSVIDDLNSFRCPRLTKFELWSCPQPNHQQFFTSHLPQVTDISILDIDADHSQFRDLLASHDFSNIQSISLVMNRLEIDLSTFPNARGIYLEFDSDSFSTVQLTSNIEVLIVGSIFRGTLEFPEVSLNHIKILVLPMDFLGSVRNLREHLHSVPNLEMVIFIESFLWWRSIPNWVPKEIPNGIVPVGVRIQTKQKCKAEDLLKELVSQL